MCGIYGCSLKPGANKASALAKFKILGLYNITRGRDATGIYIGGEINKSLKEFDDYIEEFFIDENFNGSVILGHNRQGSFGYSKTINEAHPFLINESLVFTHNGTIKNTGDLCKKYGVEEKDFNVDSKLLGTLLFTEGSDVLTHYKGAAALAYTYLETPDTLFLYHGQSKEYKLGALIEERPLFYLETEDGIFYSSLETSLESIKASREEEVFPLDYNKIYKIENGEFLFDDVIVIAREEANVTVYSTPSYNYDYSTEHLDYFAKQRLNYKNSHSRSAVDKDRDMRLIYRESFPLKLKESAKTGFKIMGDDFIYYHMGRYWEAPRKLVEGPIYLKKRGIIGRYDDKVSELFFFHRGVMLRDKAAYTAIMDMKNLVISNWVTAPDKHNFAREIAKYSVFPVTAITAEYNPDIIETFRYMWYSKDDKKNHSFTAKFSGRNYIIHEGYLTEIKSSDHGEVCIFKSPLEVDNQYSQIYHSSRVPGGSSALIIPFQEKELEKSRWFFENVYETMADVLKEWTNDEFDTIQEYVDISYKRDFSINLTREEIVMNSEFLINKSITEQKSISDIVDLDRAGDSKLILKLYNEVLSRKDFKNTLATSTISNKLEEMEKELEKEVDKLSKEDTEEYIDDVVVDSLVDLENIQSSAFDLQVQEESDYAQEVAKILLVGVDNILSNIDGISCEFPTKDALKERIKKIKDIKNVKNGTL